MGWWGKVIGGAFGFMLGGPLGALIGGALGHQFDKGMAGAGQIGYEGAAPGRDRFEGRERAQAAFFTATFAVMGHIAKADGRVSREEINLASSVMDQLDLDGEMRRTARNLFNEGKAADFTLGPVLAQFRREVHYSGHLIRVFLEIQTHASLADGRIHPAEREILERVAAALGVPQMQLRQIESMIRAEYNFRHGGSQRGAGAGDLSEPDAYAILGVDRGASDAEVKRAYRRLMSQHHPDKLVAKGLPEEMMKIATEKTQEIKLAYERVKEARGL